MNRRPAFVFFLLALVFVIGHSAPHKQFGHGDELENHAGTWLVSEGRVIYRDFFTFHMPLPYWYGAPFVKVFGNSAETFHGALYLYFVLALAALYAVNRRCAKPFGFGLFVLFVTLGHVQYWGHLYLADGVFAFSILLAFNQFWRYDGENTMSWGDWILVSAAIAVSIGSTLVASYPLAVLAVGFAAKHFLYERHGRFTKALGIAAIVAAPLVVGLTFLQATGAFREFYDCVFFFSLRFYRVTTGHSIWTPSIAPLGFFLESIANGFIHILESVVLRHGALECAYALANVGVLVVLLSSGRRVLAAFYLLYVLTLMCRMGDFHEAPYIVHSLWAAAWLFRPLGERAAEAWRSYRQQQPAPVVSYPDILRTMAATVLVVILATEYMDKIAPARPTRTAEEEIAEMAARLTMPDERIAVLPYSPDIYLMADRKPGVYSYCYAPVIDRWEFVRNRMVNSIDNQEPKLLVLNWWRFPTGTLGFQTYAEELRSAIRRNYQPISLTIPRIYARNASFSELLGRYERFRESAILEVAEYNTLPLTVPRGSPATQYFMLDDTISSAGLELLTAAPRHSDTWATISFGAVDRDGGEKVLVRKRFRTTRLRYYLGVKKVFRYSLSLKKAGDIPAGVYFFRVSSSAKEPAGALQLWTAPKPEQAGIGRATWGDKTIPRALCFRLSGLSRRKPRGVNPIVEQSLARHINILPARPSGTAQDDPVSFSQSFTVPETTTMSAVSILAALSPDEKPTTRPVLCLLKCLDAGGRTLATEPFRVLPGDREWITVAFPPRSVRKGDQLTLAVELFSSSPAAPVRIWSAGHDLYTGGALEVGGREQRDDLSFRVYGAHPPREGLPDIVLGGVDFAPAEPVTVTPPGRVNLRVNVENRGTTATGSFWIEFYAMPKDFAGPMSFAADSVNLPRVGPRQTVELNIERTLYPLPDGRYSILAIADRVGEVFESDESNNRSEAEAKSLLVVRRSSPVNLFVDQFGVGASRLRRGRMIELRGYVSNSGKAGAGRFAIQFWAASNRGDIASRIPICDPILVDSLGPNGIIDFPQYSRTLYENLPTGPFFIGCTVDPRDAIAETSEHDNTRITGPITIDP